MKRIFIAINLPEEVKNKLAKVQDEIRVNFEIDPVKWVSQENLHITLAFLGSIEEEVLRSIENELERLDFDRFEFLLDDVKYVPSRERAKMIWSTGYSKQLNNLGKEVNNILTEITGLGFDPDELTPHVTLGRVKSFEFKKQPLEEIPLLEDTFVDLNFRVESVDIMESKLKKGGPNYNKIKSINLN